MMPLLSHTSVPELVLLLVPLVLVLLLVLVLELVLLLVLELVLLLVLELVLVLVLVLELVLLLVPLLELVLLLVCPHPGGGLVELPGVLGGQALLVEVLPPELPLLPPELPLLPPELPLLPPELPLLVPLLPLLVPQPGGGLVDDLGVGGGQALLVDVLPDAWTWLGLDPFVLPLARAAPIGMVSARAKAAPKTSLNRFMCLPSSQWLSSYSPATAIAGMVNAGQRGCNRAVLIHGKKVRKPAI